MYLNSHGAFISTARGGYLTTGTFVRVTNSVHFSPPVL